jgi:hypothetical protein
MGTWYFAESAGDTTRDDAPFTDNVGRLQNFDLTRCWVSGRTDGALAFDGVDDYIDCGSHRTLNPVGGMTLMLWIKPAEVRATYTIVSRIAFGRPGAGYELRLVSGEVTAIVHDHEGRRRILTTRRRIKPDRWTFVAFTHNGRQMTLFVDGLPASHGDCRGMMPADTSFTIGRGTGIGSVNYKGAIDELRVYHIALSEEEIERHYQGYGNLAGEWIKIHHNTILAQHNHAFVLRGVPRQIAEFHHNRVARMKPQDVVWQQSARGNLRVYQNQYGPERQILD